MSTPPTSSSATDLVALADRLRYLQAFRLAVIAAVAGATFAFPDELVVSRPDLAKATGAYVLLAVLGQLWSTFAPRGRVVVFGALVMVDGLYLAWASYGTGGFASPIRYLILLHLVTVVLLASFRTGLKLALWDSLLLLVVHYAQESELLKPLPESVGVGTPFQQLIVFSAVFWFLALITATFAAVNERELRRRRYDLEALARMAARLESVTEPREVADVITDALVDTFDFRRAVLLVASEEPAPGAGSVVAEALERRSTLLVSRLDPAADERLAALLPDARNLIVLPLVSADDAVGLVVAESGVAARGRIQRRVVGMAERFTSHGALALRNAWLLEDARRRAATDGLTGLANRRTFDTVLGQELERAARGGDDVSLVLVDIDHFKRVNDEHGHQAGDDVLRRVAAAFADGSRPYDTAARYGGEEMALILPRTSLDDAVAIAERLRRAIAALPEHPRVTVSAGVASFPLGAADVEGLIAAADGALYAAKAGGRDRVEAADASPLAA